MKYLNYSFIILSVLLIGCTSGDDTITQPEEHEFESLTECLELDNLAITMSDAQRIANQHNQLIIEIIDNEEINDSPEVFMEKSFRKHIPNLDENQIIEILDYSRNKTDLFSLDCRLYTTEMEKYYSQIFEIINSNELVSVLSKNKELDQLLLASQNELLGNDIALMQVSILLAKNSILLWAPINEGGLGYHDKLKSKYQKYLDANGIDVLYPRKGTAVAAGDVAGVTGAVGWLGVASAFGAVPGANAAILGGIAWAGAWASTVAAFQCP